MVSLILLASLFIIGKIRTPSKWCPPGGGPCHSKGSYLSPLSSSKNDALVKSKSNEPECVVIFTSNRSGFSGAESKSATSNKTPFSSLVFISDSEEGERFSSFASFLPIKKYVVIDAKTITGINNKIILRFIKYGFV